MPPWKKMGFQKSVQIISQTFLKTSMFGMQNYRKTIFKKTVSDKFQDNICHIANLYYFQVVYFQIAILYEQKIVWPTLRRKAFQRILQILVKISLNQCCLGLYVINSVLSGFSMITLLCEILIYIYKSFITVPQNNKGTMFNTYKELAFLETNHTRQENIQIGYPKNVANQSLKIWNLQLKISKQNQHS
eukprot:TRINITY_DN28593_c0_g1_i1.p1 TRINITY_DN28593_c0_g1~~TRINITY_DN28593_c0_g1_i1.p1  ORF type:complete len:189 (+),score=-15.56 TRINITY_DN28593_c0_g1_i1:27-593(+)